VHDEDEVIDVKRWICAAVAVSTAVLLVSLAAGAVQMFDRSEFVARVRVAFQPLEALLPDGDSFDYDHAALFSGYLNGTDESVVIVLLDDDSPSVAKAKELGYTLEWEDVGILPLVAVMVLPPTDCIRNVEYNVPYLIRGLSWDNAEAVDSKGRFVRDVETWWARGSDEGMYFKFSGNLKIHLQTCTTISLNQS
jgi:hypothetical protein